MTAPPPLSLHPSCSYFDVAYPPYFNIGINIASPERIRSQAHELHHARLLFLPAHPSGCDLNRKLTMGIKIWQHESHCEAGCRSLAPDSSLLVVKFPAGVSIVAAFVCEISLPPTVAWACVHIYHKNAPHLMRQKCTTWVSFFFPFAIKELWHQYDPFYRYLVGLPSTTQKHVRDLPLYQLVTNSIYFTFLLL